MLEITRGQIDAVRSDTMLGSVAASNLPDPSLVTRPSAGLSNAEWDELHHACLDALMNDAPIVEEFDAEQSKGVYTVSILGVPGAYFVTAPEFDRAGVFSLLDEARNYADCQHGEFRVSEGDVEEEPEDQWGEPDPLEPVFPDSLLRVLTGAGDATALRAVRERILSDENLTLLANGVSGVLG